MTKDRPSQNGRRGEKHDSHGGDEASGSGCHSRRYSQKMAAPSPSTAHGDGTLTLLPQHVGLSLRPLNLGIPGPLWPAARAKGNGAPGHSPVSLAAHFLSWKQQLPKKRDTTC